MQTDSLEKEFHVSKFIIFYKLILGVVELVLGFGMLLFQKQVLQTYENFKNQQILEDPHDILVLVSDKLLPFILEHQGFIIFFLLLLGVVKVIGAIGMIYQKYWGQDLLVALTVMLLPFQTYSLITTPSLYKLAYFSINLFIAFYLVNFKPHQYFFRIKHRIKHYRKP